MRLNDIERDMLAGALGEPRRFALDQQLKVGRFFGAEDFVPISQAHVMADGESVGDAGADLLERLVAAGPEACRVMVPTVTDPQGVDPKSCPRLKQPAFAPARERRITAALEAMGALLTFTCINYQTVLAPVFGEHVAFGDTGSTIYANGVCGARTNFEGGPAALWAALTGRVPRYGFHLDRCRRGTTAFELRVQPRGLSDWGALGGIVGRRMASYWEVPVLLGVDGVPGSDALKHFGAALASYGSTPMFHIAGVTPEARDDGDAFDGAPPAAIPITAADLAAFYESFASHADGVDLVVFAAPQLSLYELRTLSGMVAGRRVHDGTTLIVCTSPENARGAERLGLMAPIAEAGALIIEGGCFYGMYSREVGQANGWRRLVTNSAKLVNIIGGHGYEPALASMEACVEAAMTGRLA